MASFLPALATGCGEDKGYGPPIDTAAGEQSARTAVDSSYLILSGMSNDSAVLALSNISSSVSVMVNAKLQAQYEQQVPDEQYAAPTIPRGVDELCVDVTDDEIVYDACDFQGGLLSGHLTLSDGYAGYDLTISVGLDSDFDATTTMRGDLTITDTRILGSLDYSMATSSADFVSELDLFSDFDVEVDANRCAVGGRIETHAVSVARTDSITARQSLWVKAEFGPACGDVIIR